MALTAAEKQQRYRAKQKVTNSNAFVTKTVTVTPSVAALGKLSFKDLPADVQASIEHYCSEANNGERAGSHNRAAMTERALYYHRQFGRTQAKGIDRAQLQAAADRHLEVGV